MTQQDQQKRILDAALRRFAKYGVAITDLEDVARDSGVTVGVVRGLYGDRDTLLREVVTETTDPMVAAISMISEEEDDPREWLRKSLEMYEQLMQQNPLYLKLVQRIMLQEPDTLKRMYDTNFVPSEFYERLTKFAEEGVFRLKDPFFIGLFIDCMLIFPHMLGSMIGDYFPGVSNEEFQEKKLTAMIDLLENGLYSDQASS